MSERSPRQQEHRSFLPLLSEHLSEYLREERITVPSQTRPLWHSTERALPEPQARRSQHSRQLQQTPMRQVQSPPFQSRERQLQLIQTSQSTASFLRKEGTGSARQPTESASEYRERSVPEQQTALPTTPEAARSAPQTHLPLTRPTAQQHSRF